jgi:wyosine [tRNA(Phe)-imidazoG37] synthetase (radical SAM superfamily)
MYKYIFGPVPSRRLGMSLGVDMVPRKVCSLDCVYCEVGKTTKLTVDRKAYIPSQKIILELDHYFKHNPAPDFITFSGYGEPMLNSGIGELIDYLKVREPDLPLAVLTNGTLLADEKIHAEIIKADVVLPSLDAASVDAFQKINRPHKSLDIAQIINGIAAFRKVFLGKIWLEIFILPGYNNQEAELVALKDAILKIEPDLVQLNTLDRPGTMEDLKPATYEQLKAVIDFWKLPNVQIIAAAVTRKNQKAYRNDMSSAILETIARRPCTAPDLTQIMGLHINELNKYLSVLEAEDKISQVKQERGVFYKIKQT